MTEGEFRDTLAALQLSQADFGRVLQYLSGQPVDRGTISRWATGRRSVPPLVAALLRLWTMLPEAKRQKILAKAPPLPSRLPHRRTQSIG